jgi:uncharacterized protein YcbX
MSATLAAIHIFPLKSCAPLPLAQARVQARGLEHDRRWLLVDETSTFITARKCPRLVLIRAQPFDDGLQLDAPGMPTLHVPIPDASHRTSSVVWDDTVAVGRRGNRRVAESIPRTPVPTRVHGRRLQKACRSESVAARRHRQFR